MTIDHIGPPQELDTYPFEKLDIAKAAAIAAGRRVLDFGVGDPREETPEFIRRVLAESIPAISSYPPAAGRMELREAIAAWAERRFGNRLDPSQIVPTIGSKEVLHSLAAFCVTPDRDTVIVPDPAYPVYERGANFHGAKTYKIGLEEKNGFLPDLASIPAEVLDRTALMWLNYPNNPTAATAPMSLYFEAAELARTHGFMLASDEAYSELYFEDPPSSALQLDSLDNVLVVNTLSKRSCMTGIRSGFITGDPAFIARFRKYRPSVGVTPPEFIQLASAAAWADEDHVQRQRDRWQQKRDLLVDALSSRSIAASAAATFFLWFRVPDSHTSESFAEVMLDNDLVVSPGSFFGQHGEGFVRMALVPSLDECAEAADKIRTIDWSTH